jgi:hypothetical protein
MLGGKPTPESGDRASCLRAPAIDRMTSVTDAETTGYRSRYPGQAMSNNVERGSKAAMIETKVGSFEPEGRGLIDGELERGVGSGLAYDNARPAQVLHPGVPARALTLALGGDPESREVGARLAEGVARAHRNLRQG